MFKSLRCPIATAGLILLLAVPFASCARARQPAFVGAWTEQRSDGNAPNRFVVAPVRKGGGYMLTGIYDNTAVSVVNVTAVDGNGLAFTLPVPDSPKYELTVDGAMLRGTRTPAPTGGAAGAATAVVWRSEKLLEVELADNGLSPGDLSVEVGTSVVINLRNEGTKEHRLESPVFTGSRMFLGGYTGGATVTVPTPYGNLHMPKELKVPGQTTIKMGAVSETGFYFGLDPGASAWIYLTPAKQGDFRMFCGLHSGERERIIKVTAKPG